MDDETRRDAHRAGLGQTQYEHLVACLPIPEVPAQSVLCAVSEPMLLGTTDTTVLSLALDAGSWNVSIVFGQWNGSGGNKDYTHTLAFSGSGEVLAGSLLIDVWTANSAPQVVSRYAADIPGAFTEHTHTLVNARSERNQYDFAFVASTAGTLTLKLRASAAGADQWTGASRIVAMRSAT